MGETKRSSDKNRVDSLDDPALLDDGLDLVETQHPTVIPKFDPTEYAEQFEVREAMPTLTDDAILAELEKARLKSARTSAPPSRARSSSLPGPRDSLADIDSTEDDFDTLGIDEQVAVLEDRLAPLSRIPTLTGDQGVLAKVLADPKAVYVMGFIDGVLPLQTILDVTGLPELDTLRVLDQMITLGVIVCKRSSR